MLKISDLALSKNKTCYQGGKGGERAFNHFKQNITICHK